MEGVIHGVVALGPEWLSPENLIGLFGAFAILGVCAIVFIETGLLVGFFLPGDSLLFTAGLLMATGVIQTPIWIAAPLIGLAAFIGDQVGYQIGKASGPRVFNRPNSRFFRQEYVDKTHEYFERFVSSARAVEAARHCCTSVGAKAGFTSRVIITDGGDAVNFEWKRVEGIVFPPELVGSAWLKN